MMVLCIKYAACQIRLTHTVSRTVPKNGCVARGNGGGLVGALGFRLIILPGMGVGRAGAHKAHSCPLEGRLGLYDLSPEAAECGNLWGCALPTHLGASVWVLVAGQGCRLIRQEEALRLGLCKMTRKIP